MFTLITLFVGFVTALPVVDIILAALLFRVAWKIISWPFRKH